MEPIKDILPRVRTELLQQSADMYAWDKYIEYLTDLEYTNEDIELTEKYETAIEVYNKAYKDYLDKYSLDNK